MNIPAFWKNINLAGLNPFRKEEGFVALDIGSSSIKMVEAAGEKTGYRLVNVGMLPLPPTAVQNNMVADTDVVVKTIQSLIETNGIKAKRVISAVPGRAVIIKKIQLPAQGQEELEANVEFEATNVIPESLENVNLDYQVLNYVEDGSKMEVLLVAVKKEIINSYTQVIQGAGLTPAIMDVDYFAMENMYEANYEIQPDTVVGLIHIGARYTSINVLKSGVSTFTGDLQVGGEAFTESLVQALQVSYDQAETVKVTGSLEGKKRDDLEELLKPSCESVAEEISRTLSLYAGMAAEEGIHNIYLSGGSAKVPGLCALLGERLGVPVQLAEPFRGFNVAKNIDKDYLAESALVLAVGAGLSIRRLGDK
ncbi:MAG: type IV pilus assembly protein PilM [Deltaproteobacteria bacterium]|nr:type IV pilus assembly protein PilM [Deltaproteobacteria bacterium]